MSAVTGEVRVGGHTLRFTTRSLVRLEDRLGVSIQKAFVDPGVKVIVAALAVGADITDDQAYAVCDELGLAVVGLKIGEAMKAAFPEVADGGPLKAA